MFVELEVELLQETDLAILVCYNRMEEWIPKSCIDYGSCEFEDNFFEEGEVFVIALAEWKAKELGWDGSIIEI